MINLLFFYLGGSFVVAAYWWMDKIEGDQKNKKGHSFLMVFWPIVIFIYIIGKKLSIKKGGR